MSEAIHGAPAFAEARGTQITERGDLWWAVKRPSGRVLKRQAETLQGAGDLRRALETYRAALTKSPSLPVKRRIAELERFLDFSDRMKGWSAGALD